MQHSFGPKIVPCLTMSFTKIFLVIPFGVLISIFASLNFYQSTRKMMTHYFLTI